jgi:hypothetical protein
MRERRVLSRSKAREALRHEALLSAPDAGLGLVRAVHDLVRADTLGRQQNALGAPDILLRGVAVADQRLELAAIRRGNRKRNSCAHAKDSHTKPRSRIPNGFKVRFYPLEGPMSGSDVQPAAAVRWRLKTRSL